MTITRFISAGASLACGAALLLAATAPALAATDPMPPRDSASQQQYRVKHDAKGKALYCTTIPPITGSRISQNVCKSAKDWKAEGVELNVQ